MTEVDQVAREFGGGREIVDGDGRPVRRPGLIVQEDKRHTDPIEPVERGALRSVCDREGDAVDALAEKRLDDLEFARGIVRGAG